MTTESELLRDALIAAHSYIVNTDAMERCGLPPNGCRNDVCICVESHTALINRIEAALTPPSSDGRDGVVSRVLDLQPWANHNDAKRLYEFWPTPEAAEAAVRAALAAIENVHGN